MKVFVGEVWQVGSSEISVMVRGCRGHYTAYCETFPGVSCTASTIKRALGGFVDAAHDHLSTFIAALPLHQRRQICLWMQDDEAPGFFRNLPDQVFDHGQFATREIDDRRQDKRRSMGASLTT